MINDGCQVVNNNMSAMVEKYCHDEFFCEDFRLKGKILGVSRGKESTSNCVQRLVKLICLSCT